MIYIESDSESIKLIQDSSHRNIQRFIMSIHDGTCGFIAQNTQNCIILDQFQIVRKVYRMWAFGFVCSWKS